MRMNQVKTENNNPELSLFLPVLDEEQNLRPMHAKISEALNALGKTAEVIYVDDGSTDKSLQVLREIAAQDSRVRVISLRRNYGQTAAMSAGIDAAQGEILIPMDADLPKALREKLNETATGSTLKVESRYVSEDGTRRFLMKTHDNFPVETVFIPTENRDTICFSSQSGCPLKCDFCLTAKLGLLRNLTAGEIVEQIIVVLNDVYGEGAETPHGTNLVAMGAGEPFLNFENLTKAIETMADEEGLFIVPRLLAQPSESRIRYPVGSN